MQKRRTCRTPLCRTGGEAARTGCLAEAGTMSEELRHQCANTSNGYRVGTSYPQQTERAREIEASVFLRSRPRSVWWRGIVSRWGATAGPSLVRQDLSCGARTAATWGIRNWRPMRSPPCIPRRCCELRTREGERQREILRSSRIFARVAAIRADGHHTAGERR